MVVRQSAGDASDDGGAGGLRRVHGRVKQRTVDGQHVSSLGLLNKVEGVQRWGGEQGRWRDIDLTREKDE